MMFLKHLFSSHLHLAVIIKDIMSAYIYWAHILAFQGCKRISLRIMLLLCYGLSV